VPRAHKRRFSGAWWLKVVGLAPLGIAGVTLLSLAVVFGARFATRSSAHNLHTWLTFLITALVTGALGYLGWRRPGLVGLLILVLLTPVGLLFGLYVLGGSTFDVVFGELVAACPVVSGLLLIVAAGWRSRAPIVVGRGFESELSCVHQPYLR